MCAPALAEVPRSSVVLLEPLPLSLVRLASFKAGSSSLPSWLTPPVCSATTVPLLVLTGKTGAPALGFAAGGFVPKDCLMEESSYPMETERVPNSSNATPRRRQALVAGKDREEASSDDVPSASIHAAVRLGEWTAELVFGAGKSRGRMLFKPLRRMWGAKTLNNRQPCVGRVLIPVQLRWGALRGHLLGRPDQVLAWSRCSNKQKAAAPPARYRAALSWHGTFLDGLTSVPVALVVGGFVFKPRGQRCLPLGLPQRMHVSCSSHLEDGVGYIEFLFVLEISQ